MMIKDSGKNTKQGHDDGVSLQNIRPAGINAVMQCFAIFASLREFFVCGKKKPAPAVPKPNSVPGPDYSEPGNDHSSADAGCPASPATYPGARTGSPQTLLYLVLHRVGFTKLLRSPGERCALTAPFHPYLIGGQRFGVRGQRCKTPYRSPLTSDPPIKAVYFLLHFPSRCRDFGLQSTLPCGVRTFLRV